ncbi:MAG: ATP-binding protein [Parasporobacterium sp.]|nr:ATP-binding protein [Parasporobacterium sp.]
MYREIINDFEKWYDNPSRKPLVVSGAKSVGKTWAVKDFGDGFFDNILIFDLKEGGFKDFSEQFLSRDISGLAKKSSDFGGTLIVFENLSNDADKSAQMLIDEIASNTPGLYICFTSNLTKSELFGRENVEDKVDFLKMYPMSFGEFLIVNNQYELSSKIEKQKEEDLSDSDLDAIIRFLKIFYIVGGMPEAVKTWLDEKDLDKVEAVKKKILDSYMEDFDNIESANVRGKVIEVWNSLTKQLEDENKKFQYGQVKITARAREYEVGVEWLEKRGYVNKLFKIKSDKTSVKNEVDSKSFELFLTDVGLLTSMYGITYDDLNKDKSSILIKNSAIIEQFVHQELIYNTNIGQIFYWTSEATARIPFVFEDSGQIIPIDINVTGSTKAQSLKVYRQRYKNPMSVTITYEKFSMNDGLLNIPVYSVWNL